MINTKPQKKIIYSNQLNPMTLGANLSNLSRALGKNFLANKKQILVLFPLYSQWLPLLSLFKNSIVTSLL